jgi:hypothetical protein
MVWLMRLGKALQSGQFLEERPITSGSENLIVEVLKNVFGRVYAAESTFNRGLLLRERRNPRPRSRVLGRGFPTGYGQSELGRPVS